MTSPEFRNKLQEAQRRRWLTPYLTLQEKNEQRIKKIFNLAAKDALKEVSALKKSSTFSAGVRTAQLRIVLEELQPIVKKAFDDTLDITGNGQKDAAELAVNILGRTDEDYLKAALTDSGIPVASYLAGERQSARLNVISAISSITHADYKLSKYVYGSNALAKGWLKNSVAAMILRGTSAQEIARVASSSIRGDVPGGVSYAALRLGRTELNNAFHATNITLAQDRPWIPSMKWNLSHVHSFNPNRAEICEQYSQKEWRVEAVPPKPHPQCRCYVTPNLVPYEQFIQDLTNNKYRSWIDAAA